MDLTSPAMDVLNQVPAYRAAASWQKIQMYPLPYYQTAEQSFLLRTDLNPKLLKILALLWTFLN